MSWAEAEDDIETTSERAGEDYHDLSPTVTAVYERILHEILDGLRHAGDPVRDRDIAAEFGVSRTPVREAIQMLRHVGVIETSPSRYTRIALLTPDDVEQAGRIVMLLFRQIVEEVAASGIAAPAEELAALNAAAADAARRGDRVAFFRHCYVLHHRIADLSENAHLRRAFESVTNALGLAVITNADAIDLDHLVLRQQQTIDALRTGAVRGRCASP